MNTITILSGLGQTPGQYSARARAQARLFTQARQRGNIDYNIRNWRPDLPRVRAQRSGRSNLPPIPLTEAETRRRAEARTKTSARLQQMFMPRPRRGSVTRASSNVYGRLRQERNKRIALQKRERLIADEQAELARRLDKARRIAEAQELGIRRAAAQAMPDPRQVLVSTPPPAITPPPSLPTPAMPQSDAWSRQSTEDLQRLVDARRKLGIRGII